MESMETTESSTKGHNLSQISVKFVTKETRFAIPSTPYAINGSTIGLELNSLIKTLIREDNDSEDDLNLEDIEFDFVINGKLLRVSVQELVESEGMNCENAIEIEFIVKSCPPKPNNSLLHDDWVSCVDCRHNWIISGCYDSCVHIWDASTDGSHKIAIPAHLAPIKDIKWIVGPNDDDSEDHMFVSSSHDETAIVWKWNSNSNQVEYLFSCRGHSRSVDCLDVNHDLIATGSYDQMLKVWSLVEDKSEPDMAEASTSKQKKLKKNDGSESGDKSRTPIITMSGHREAVTGCVWMRHTSSSDTSITNIATCSMDNTIRLWDIEVGESKQTLTGNKAFLSLSYSPLNHYLITGSCDRHIRLWDPRSDGSLVKAVYSSHESWVSSIDWSNTSEHEFISGSYDNVVKQWDIRSPNAPLYDLIGHEDKVLCVNWSSDQYMISGSADNHLKIFSNPDKKM